MAMLSTASGLSRHAHKLDLTSMKRQLSPIHATDVTSESR
jgi:hypothetical protein